MDNYRRWWWNPLHRVSKGPLRLMLHPHIPNQKRRNQYLLQQMYELYCFIQCVSGSPGGPVVKESTCQCRRHKRHRLNPWVRKIPWRRKWQPTPVLAGKIPWTEEPGGLHSMGLQSVRLSEHACIRTHAHIGSSLSYIKCSVYSMPPFACVCVCSIHLDTCICRDISERLKSS